MMRAVFDANMLIWLFDDAVERPPAHPITGEPVGECKARVAHLFRTMSARKDQIIIPAPALAEALVGMKPGRETLIMEALKRPGILRIAPFDALAATECARLIKSAKLDRGKLGDGQPGGRAKIKFDLQIISIMNVHQANGVYSSDPDVLGLAEREGRSAIGVWDLELPAWDLQQELIPVLPEGNDLTDPRG